jgi:hypothetical protein
MSDFVYLVVLAGFSLLSWALILMCEWLMGGGK